MNFKNKSTFTSNIFIGIVMIIGGLFYAWYHREVLLTFNSAEKMYKDGYYFTSAASNNTDSIYAAAIYNIVDTGYGSDDGKSEVYAVWGDDGIYFLESNPNNKEIISMVEFFDKYANEEHTDDEPLPIKYLMVEPHTDSTSSLSDIADAIDPDYTFRNREDVKLFDDFYISRTSLTKDIAFNLGVTLIIMAIGVGIIIVALTRKSKNQDNYDKLCELDERFRDNIGELENVADYVDKSLGAFVYKNHLILNTKFGFDMFNLNNLVWLYHNVTKHKMYAVITVSIDFALQINLYEDGRIREQRVMLTNDKKAEDSIGSLLTYIGINYPNALIGFTPETKQAYQEFKLSHR